MIERAHLERALARLAELESRLADPSATGNQAAYRTLVREHAAARKTADKVRAYLALQDDVSQHRELLAAEDTDAELRTLAREELSALEGALPAAERDLKMALLPPEPDESRNAIMEIRAGTGGSEAALFAGDLFRMYARYAEHRSWRLGLVDASPGEMGGYKEVVFSVEGEGAYGCFRYEAGTHRVQRVPATEAAGRIHTSAATVAVFPQAEAEDDIGIAPDEIRIDIFRSSGPGGQSVNTTDSAVRVTHVPTGIVVQCQDEKSQHRNRERALSVLKARLLDRRRQEEAERMGNTRRHQIGSGDRSGRIRTYNFPQNRVTDHRINLTLHSLDRVLEGDLDELSGALRDHDVQLRLEAAAGGGKPGGA